MAVNQARGWYDTGGVNGSGSSGTVFADANSLFPLIISYDGVTVTAIDFKLLAAYSTPSGSAPPIVPGSGLQYPTLAVSGQPLPTAPETTAQAAYWGAIYVNAHNFNTAGYPGNGNVCANPYGDYFGMYTADGRAVVVSDLFRYGFATPSNKIIGGVSSSNSANGVVCYLLNPTTCTASYDVIPALSGNPGFIIGVFPCADRQHLLILTNNTLHQYYAENWHVVSLGTLAAVEVAAGPWTSGPGHAGPEWFADYPGSGSATRVTNAEGKLQTTSTSVCAMLESDLTHFWMVDPYQDITIMSLTAGQNQTVLYQSFNNTGPAVIHVSNFGVYIESGFPPMCIYADQGAAAIIFGNLMAFWERATFTQTALEVDVAKEAIAGDASWRTIFCGFDVPRFTDLGLASGLTASGNPVTGSSTVAGNVGPYPIYYRKLGVPNPNAPPSSALVPAAAGSNTVKLVDTFDAPINWNLPPNTATSGGAFVIVGGNPGAYMQVQSIGNTQAIASKSFGVDPTLPVTVEYDLSFIRLFNARLQPSWMDCFVGLDSSLSGSVIRIQNGPTGVTLHFASVSNGVIGPDVGTYFIAAGSIPTWHTDSDPTFTGWIQSTQWAHITAAITPVTGASTSGTIVFTAKIGSSVAFTQTQAGMPIAGSGAGVGCLDPVENYPDWIILKIDNFTVTGQGPAAATQNLQSTTYLYTLVNDLGEESGPSPALLNADGSNTITRAIGRGVQVTLPGSLLGAGVDQTYFQVNPPTFIPSVQLNGTTPSPSMNLYRAVTGSTGTSLLLVAANIAFGEIRTVNTSGSTSTTGNPSSGVIDNLPDSALSEVIPSLFTVNGVQGFWAPPPVDMLGILSLPNEIYAGFSKNNLCLSAQGVPHAWPLLYQLTFDYDIVAIQNIDTTVVVLTKNFPWLCSGNTPDAYSQTKASYPYRCASKRSVKYLKNVGVVFATFEGLCAIAGVGQERILTEGLFSKREWLALNPPSMIADINDGRYYCWFTTLAGAQGGFYIDVQDAGAGKVSLGWHATARYTDPLSDILYVAPDFVDPAIPIGVSLQRIAAFDTPGQAPLPYSWKSKQFYVQWPTTPRMARVSADSYASLTLTLFADGVQYASIPITSQTEFGLPPPPNGTIEKYFEFGLAGTDFVNRVQVVEDVDEFQ